MPLESWYRDLFNDMEIVEIYYQASSNQTNDHADEWFRIQNMATNRIYTAPFLTSLVSLKSWDRQLFNDTKLVKNGAV